MGNLCGGPPKNVVDYEPSNRSNQANSTKPMIGTSYNKTEEAKENETSTGTKQGGSTTQG